MLPEVVPQALFPLLLIHFPGAMMTGVKAKQCAPSCRAAEAGILFARLPVRGTEAKDNIAQRIEGGEEGFPVFG